MTRRSWEQASIVLGLYHDAALIGGVPARTDCALFACLSDVYSVQDDLVSKRCTPGVVG
jgi:hypothetical protein